MVRVFVEGGGHNNELSRSCRRGFAQFFRNAGLAGYMPRVIACGSREDAYDRFRAELHKDSTVLLLVDAEAPVTAQRPWQHLKQSDGWTVPPGASDDQCHLMVEAMESWFLADRDALRVFYGRGFQPQRLPANPSIEKIPKQDIFSGLENATQNTGKGAYKKGTDSYEMLGRLDPAKVRAASPYADRFINAL